MTKVVVTMNETGAFGRPVAGLTFLVVTENGDRVSIVTDDAGVASTWLSPANYRFVTPDPVEWQGKAYTWDLIVPVKVGAAIVKLSQENASKVVAISSPMVSSPPTEVVGQSRRETQTARPSDAAIPFQYKDGTTATLLSVLITGGGQMYAGETGKGLVMLLGGVTAIVVGYTASNCDAYGCENVSPLITGEGVAVGIWIISLVDAHSAAARHNALAPRAALLERIGPVMQAGVRGTTKVGFALRY